MRLRRLLFVFCICGASWGCGTSVPEQVPVELPAPTPLSVTQWKELPVAEKYDPTTFERLKLNDPKLQRKPAWDKFMEEVVVPERKKDVPTSPE